MVTLILLVVGGLNWLLVGLGDWNLVEKLLGNWPAVVKLVYILVGLSAVVVLFTHKKDCKMCSSGSTAMPM
ncbi:MAG: hypothetical protein G01um101472_63 [Parcubacteria group bacterium Gr01-1014_72]|nr:MAG: hypothetical protein G01um101472_63 [Parcubacteria group bacterium Gr01-1014_72]